MHNLLFPKQSRFFPGQRWANIILRTIHLIGIAGCGYAFLGTSSAIAWEPYLMLTLITGLLLSLLYTWSNGIFLVQLRGQAIFLKIALLALILVFPHYKAPLFVAILLLSGLISHAPGDVRYYSIYHRKRIEAL